MTLRILIVEDEPLIALDLEAILEDAGHTVVGIAASMRRALELASVAVPFDLAIMDIDLMDGRRGVEAAQALREQHDITSLFVSGTIDDEVRAEALAWKPLGFVSKPFIEQQITRILAKFIPAAKAT